MKGRLEHSLKIEKNIQDILSELPRYVTYYYYEFKAGRQPTACREYIRKISKFLNYIDSKNLKEINPKNISKFQITCFLDSLEYIQDKDGNKKQSSLSYRKSYHTILKSFFDFLFENEYIDENPMLKIKRVRGEDFVTRKYLDEIDLKKVLLAIETGAGDRRSVAMQKKWKERDKAILMILIQTGIRETALSEINVEDIDFENHIIKSVIEKGHKDKTFTMCSQLEKALEEWIIKRKYILSESNQKEDALFISKSKKRISQKSLSNIVEKFTKEALGYSITPHKIRASFANIMLEKTNENIYVVQQLLGHARTETTKIYLKNNLNQYNEMAAQVIEETVF